MLISLSSYLYKVARQSKGLSRSRLAKYRQLNIYCTIIFACIPRTEFARNQTKQDISKLTKPAQTSSSLPFSPPVKQMYKLFLLVQMYKEAAFLYNKENAAEANHAQDKTLLKAQLPEESEGDNKMKKIPLKS